MKPTVQHEHDAHGQEAPMVIGPRSIVRLVKQVASLFRSRDSRKSEL